MKPLEKITLGPLGVGLAHRALPWKWTLCAGLKDSIPEKSRKGLIYSVPFMECDAVYIGETLRNLERLREHQRHVEKKDLKGSAIAEHVIKTGHTIAWNEAQVIDYSSCGEPGRLRSLYTLNVSALTDSL